MDAFLRGIVGGAAILVIGLLGIKLISLVLDRRPKKEE